VSTSRLFVLPILATVGWGCSTHRLQKQEALLQKALKQGGPTCHPSSFPLKRSWHCSVNTGRMRFCAFRRVGPSQDCCPPNWAFVLVCETRECRRKSDSFPCSPVFEASSMLGTNDLCTFLSCQSFFAAASRFWVHEPPFFHRRLGSGSWFRSFFFCFHVTAIFKQPAFLRIWKTLKG
jgi:hypothetical protein